MRSLYVPSPDRGFSHQNYPIWLKKRQLLFICLAALALLLIHVRFFYLQIPEHEKWLKKAQKQHLVEHSLIARRGSFKSASTLYAHHSASGYSFNKEVPVYHLFVDTSALTPRSFTIIEELLTPFAPSKQELVSHLRKKSKSRRTLSYLTPKQQDQIAFEWAQIAKKEKLPKNLLFFLRHYARSYPHGETLGYLLQAVAQYKDPLSHYIQPVGGLELLFNKKLTGTPGKLQLARTLKNPLLYQERYSAPEDGSDIFLSIHPQLQAYCERVLSDGVQRHQAKSAWCVVADCQDGQILALAQYPRFDPGRYGSYYSSPQELWKTRVWAVQDAFEPGSIFKPIFLTIALKANEELISQGKPALFDPQEWIDLSQISLKGRKTRLKDTSFARYVNMDMAVKKSSNIYMAYLAQSICERLGSQWFAEEIASLGFSKPTGIEFPAEARGLIPSPGKKYPNGTLQWSLPTPQSISMGHNILVNSLQIVKAYCAIANGGKSVQPSILLKSPNAPIPASENLISPSICERVRKAMAHVIFEGGSGVRGKVKGYSMGGKSGTAHKIRGGKYDPHLTLASFVGIVPLQNPRFVILVTYDEPAWKYLKGKGFNHRGSFCSAPSLSLIARETLRTFNVAPDEGTDYATGNDRSNEQIQPVSIFSQEAKELNEEFTLRNFAE